MTPLSLDEDLGSSGVAGYLDDVLGATVVEAYSGECVPGFECVDGGWVMGAEWVFASGA